MGSLRLMKPAATTSCQGTLKGIAPTSTMRRFTELLLLATCIFLLPLFVYGLGSFHSTVKYNAEQRGTVIGGLLVIRQDNYYCPYAGEYICESIHCCPGGWNCCRGLSPLQLFFSSSIAQLKISSDGSCCRPA